MPHQIRTVDLLSAPASGRSSTSRSSRKRVRVALMTRAHRPAIAPVVRSPQRPTAPDRLAQGSRPRSVKSWCCRRLAAAMINRRSLRSAAARRHESRPEIRVDARAAVCPKRSPSPLLISSPQHPTDDPHEAVRMPRYRSALRSGTTLIRLLIRPTGGPGRCRRPQRTGHTTRHAEAARSGPSHAALTGTEPGGPPPGSTATTLTDLSSHGAGLIDTGAGRCGEGILPVGYDSSAEVARGRRFHGSGRGSWVRRDGRGGVQPGTASARSRSRPSMARPAQGAWAGRCSTTRRA